MPISEIWNSEPPEALEGLAENFSRSFPKKYDFVKTFVQTPTSTAGGGNGVTSLDDPTYLGFDIRFDISSPLFNGALSGDPGIGESEAGGEGHNAGNNGSHPAGESAVGYLEKVGEATRATYLKAFAQGLREIQTKRPYYFQTIDGLEAAWNKTVNMTPYGGSDDGEGITIGMLEAIDLKMSALFNLYKAACYDVKYRRNIIPINLMYFNVEVDILEIRKFKSTRNWISSLNPLSPNKEMDKFVNANTSKITLRFEECTWDAQETGKVFGNVANDGSNAIAVSSMKWSYGRVEILSQFSGYDSALKDSANLQPKTFKDLAKAAGQKFLDKGITAAENLVQRKALSFVRNLQFGNAFGLRNQIINTIQNPIGLLNSLNGAAVQEGQSSPAAARSVNDNIFANDVTANKSSQALTSSRLFPNRPSGPPLESTNIFE